MRWGRPSWSFILQNSFGKQPIHWNFEENMGWQFLCFKWHTKGKKNSMETLSSKSYILSSEQRGPRRFIPRGKKECKRDFQGVLSKVRSNYCWMCLVLHVELFLLLLRKLRACRTENLRVETKNGETTSGGVRGWGAPCGVRGVRQRTSSAPLRWNTCMPRVSKKEREKNVFGPSSSQKV